MNDNEIKVELEARISKLVKNFAGVEITQNLITGIWAATYDEIKHFNEEVMNFSQPVIDWLHSQYVNRIIKINTSTGIMTIGELTVQNNAPKIGAIALIDLYRLRQIFQNTLLESDIVEEISARIKNGTN